MTEQKAQHPGEVRRKKVFVGMSGGVDSSVAALLLHDEGYDVVGMHLRCWNKDGCDEPEAEDARRVAEKLGIPFYVLDMEKEYKERVVNYMIDGYRKGITPNPDVMCNKEIKFGLFLEKALSMGADYVATGHYVRLRRTRIVNKELRIKDNDSSFIIHHSLFIARDGQKDQSYFLWTLTQEQLQYALFPLGELTKDEVRTIAREADLPTAEKKDSQGICFIGEVTLQDFLSEYLPRRRGNAVTLSGRIVGTHDGAHLVTIGQRHGLGIAVNEPVYVANKDVTTNTVVLAPRDDPALYRDEIALTDVSFITPIPGLIRANYADDETNEVKVFARVRYRQPLQQATLYKLPTANYSLKFDTPVECIAPGQSAVFYSQEGELIGGGIIE